MTRSELEQVRAEGAPRSSGVDEAIFVSTARQRADGRGSPTTRSRSPRRPRRASSRSTSRRAGRRIVGGSSNTDEGEPERFVERLYKTHDQPLQGAGLRPAPPSGATKLRRPGPSTGGSATPRRRSRSSPARRSTRPAAAGARRSAGASRHRWSRTTSCRRTGPRGSDTTLEHPPEHQVVHREERERARPLVLLEPSRGSAPRTAGGGRASTRRGC